ncbi:MAG: hypothetical protein BYD32DRAFT_67692 [Podila humilis]|nr:MAG: hypothetical protein BYD32DRAFT_67692 [Podila humilis]
MLAPGQPPSRVILDRIHPYTLALPVPTRQHGQHAHPTKILKVAQDRVPARIHFHGPIIPLCCIPPSLDQEPVRSQHLLQLLQPVLDWYPAKANLDRALELVARQVGQDTGTVKDHPFVLGLDVLGVLGEDDVDEGAVPVAVADADHDPAGEGATDLGDEGVGVLVAVEGEAGSAKDVGGEGLEQDRLAAGDSEGGGGFGRKRGEGLGSESDLVEVGEVAPLVDPLRDILPDSVVDEGLLVGLERWYRGLHGCVCACGLWCPVFSPCPS